MRKLATITAAVVMVLGSAGVASANATAPTNGGNGAGQSGQCTGPQADRPASCQSTHK